MANALAFEMPRDENPLSPIPTVGSPAPAAGPSKSKKNGLAFTQPVAPPQPRKMAGPAKPQGNALGNMASAFMPQQQKPDAMYAFVDTLQRTVDPAGAQAREAKMTADQQTKLQQGLAFVQQMKAIPADKRMAFAQQGVGQFGLGQTQFDPNGFTDEALAMSEATLSAQLGQAPEAPEYMNLGGGNVGKVQGGTFSMAREAPQEAKPANLDRAVGANGNFWTFDPATGNMKDTGIKAPPESAAGGGLKTEVGGNGNFWTFDPTTGTMKDTGVRAPAKESGGGSDSGLTPNQRLTAQLKIDDLDRELADVERGRKSSLSTVTSSIALLEDFLSPENKDTFNEVYGNWINPTGEGNDLLNPRVTPGSKRANGMAILEQLGGRAFLDSIQAMKGTGALSDREGAKVGAAATRLMQVTQDDDAARRAGQEFLVTLQSYKAALENDIQASRTAEASRRQQVASMMGVPVPPQQPGAQPAPSAPVALTGKLSTPGGRGAQTMQARVASQATGVPQDAILEMMTNPTPDEMAQFNEVFGDGMAQRIMNGQF